MPRKSGINPLEVLPSSDVGDVLTNELLKAEIYVTTMEVQGGYTSFFVVGDDPMRRGVLL